MKQSIAIFIHAWRMLFQNIGVALRISLVLYVVTLLSTLVGLLSILSTVLGAWLAVAWHRYVLLGEAPKGWLPKWHGISILWYILYLWLIALILLGLGLIVGAPTFALAFYLAPLAQILSVVVVALPMIYVWLRLAVLLPLAAIGERGTIKGAWTVTRPARLPLFLLSIVLLILFAGMQILAIPENLFLIPVLIVLYWFVWMMTLTMFTVIYGHYVEGRPLH